MTDNAQDNDAYALRAQSLGEVYGHRLCEHRINARLTQQELADKACLSLNTIKNLENKGNLVSLDVILRVILALGLNEHLHGFLALPEKEDVNVASVPRRRRVRKARSMERLAG